MEMVWNYVPDLDGDVTNELDNCPMDYNPDQANNDNRFKWITGDNDMITITVIFRTFPFDLMSGQILIETVLEIMLILMTIMTNT